LILALFQVQLRPGARNGFGEPRDWEPKSTLSRPQPAAETARPAFEPPKCPQIAGYSSETRKRRFAVDCVVDLRGLKLRARHAVAVEPVSAYYRLKKLRNLGVFRRFNATN
jgi:hypothetical protein